MEEPIDRLRHFFQIASQHRFTVRYDSVEYGWGEWTDCILRARLEAFTDSPDRIRQLVRNRILDNDNQALLPSLYRSLFVPMEPASYDEIGLTAFRTGVSTVASPEITSLFWNLTNLLNVDRFDDVEPIGRAGLDRYLQTNKGATAVAHLFPMLSRIPDEYFGLPYDPRNYFTGIYPGDNAIELEPAFHILRLEECNGRKCDHCATLNHRNLPHMKPADIKKWLGAFGHCSVVIISGGEPFYWAAKEGPESLANVIQFLFESEKTRLVRIVTSGLGSDAEIEAAEALVQLPNEMKNRIAIGLSVSDYPHFERAVEEQAEAARTIQKDTIAFFLKSGIRVGANVFIGMESFIRDILRPALEKARMAPSPDLLIKEKNDFGARDPILFGKWARKVGKYHSLQTAAFNSCIFNAVKIDIPASIWKEYLDRSRSREEREAILSPWIDRAFKLELSGNGILSPGCCAFISNHVEIADLRTDSPEAAREKLVAFEARARKLRRNRQLNCLSCLANADKIADPKRLKAVIGAQQFEKVVSLRRRWSGT